MDQKTIKKYQADPGVQMVKRAWPDKKITHAPIWTSVDLRDGNQALINPMNMDQKLKLFDLLANIGFKEIEVGFPSAAKIEFDFMRRIIEEDRIPQDVTVQLLTQAREHLIQKSFESIRGARRVIVHLYNSTSTLQRKVVFRKDKEEILKIAEEGTRMVKKYAADTDTEIVFQYSPESFTGTEIEYAAEVCNHVIDIWQPSPDRKMIINLPATVEESTPNIYADRVEWMHNNLIMRDSVILSLHAHNDRGTAVAATEMGLMAGADRVEGTLFANGERTGNVDIVTVALNLYTQGIDPGLDFSDINSIKDVVEECTEIGIHPRHPYVGELVYTAFSGSHQDAINKGMIHQKRMNEEVAAKDQIAPWEVPYLPMDPKDLGRSYEAIIRINSQSGKGGVAFILKDKYGIDIPKKMHPEFSKVIQGIADKKEIEISSEEIWEAFRDEYLGEEQIFGIEEFKYLDAQTAHGVTSIEFNFRIQGRPVRITGQGNGPIDACKSALVNAGVDEFVIESYEEKSLQHTSKSDAIAFIQISNRNYESFFGVGIDSNITIASLRALMSALNRAQRVASMFTKEKAVQ